MAGITMWNHKEALERLNQRIIFCRRCKRLIDYISKVSNAKVHRYMGCPYWGKPIPGFGDSDARLLIIGLAPAAHGGNRTGRMFTGNSSGDWLIKALYETGFSNQQSSVSRDDRLELTSAYITASVRCAPPRNRPNREEIENCSEYLLEEIRLLERVEVVLTLGRIAFDTYLKYAYPRDHESKPPFRHGKIYVLKDMPMLAVSYHPSRQNTQTGRLTWEMWLGVFKIIKEILE